MFTIVYYLFIVSRRKSCHKYNIFKTRFNAKVSTFFEIFPKFLALIIPVTHIAKNQIHYMSLWRSFPWKSYIPWTLHLRWWRVSGYASVLVIVEKLIIKSKFIITWARPGGHDQLNWRYPLQNNWNIFFQVAHMKTLFSLDEIFVIILFRIQKWSLHQLQKYDLQRIELSFQGMHEIFIFRKILNLRAS